MMINLVNQLSEMMSCECIHPNLVNPDMTACAGFVSESVLQTVCLKFGLDRCSSQCTCRDVISVRSPSVVKSEQSYLSNDWSHHVVYFDPISMSIVNIYVLRCYKREANDEEKIVCFSLQEIYAYSYIVRIYFADVYF